MIIDGSTSGTYTPANVGTPTLTATQPRAVSPTKNRFSEAPWFDWMQNKSVLLIGAGGIGSWVGMCLARIGCALVIMDDDLVELHNLGGQMFSVSQVNISKVDALRQNIHNFAGANSMVYVETERFDEDSMISPIVIMAVDNMKTRKAAFEAWVDLIGEDTQTPFLFIDGRLLAEDYQVYAVTPDRIEAYRDTLFDDAEVPTEQCTLKSTTHCSLGIASDIVGILTNYAANKATKAEIGVETRDVPFKIVKNIPNFMYDITFEPNAGSTDGTTTGSTTAGTSDSPTEDKEGTDNRGLLQVHTRAPELVP